MKRQLRFQALLLAAVVLCGAVLYALLYHFDNIYTAALPGGYGYNVLQDNPDDIAFLVDGWEYYPGQLLSPADFDKGVTPELYTYIGQYCCAPAVSISTALWQENRAARNRMPPVSWTGYMPWPLMGAQRSSFNAPTIRTTTPVCIIRRLWDRWAPFPEC